MASEVEPAKAKLNWAKIKANVKEKGYQVDNSFNKSSRGGSPTNDGSPGGGLKRRMSSNNLKKENSGSFKAKQTVLASWGSPSPSASPPSPHRMNSRQLLWEEPPPLPPPTWLPAQVHVANVYHHRAVQLFIASVIVSSFVASIMEKEWDPDRVAYPALWPLLDNLFNSIFLVEILANAYSHNIITFLRRGWNLFDLLVVVVGICTMAKIDLGPVSAVKVFRVFRLFPRVPSLNELFISILRSIPGVINALIILFLVMCIYGILGVTLFKRFGSAKDPYVTTDSFGEGVDVIYALTTPKQCLRDADPARDSKQCHSDREMLLGEEVRAKTVTDTPLTSRSSHAPLSSSPDQHPFRRVSLSAVLGHILEVTLYPAAGSHRRVMVRSRREADYLWIRWQNWSLLLLLLRSALPSGAGAGCNCSAAG